MQQTRVYSYLKKTLEKKKASYHEGYIRSEKEPSKKTYYFSAKPKKPKAMVVLVHGTGEHALYPGFSLIESLIENGYETFSFDLPGHGPNSKGLFTKEACHGFLFEVHKKAAFLAQDRKVHLLGMSLGGALSLRALQSEKKEAGLGFSSMTLLGVPTSLALDPQMLLPEVWFSVNKNILSLREKIGLWEMLPAFGPFKRSFFPIRLEGGGPASLLYMGKVAELLEEADLLAFREKLAIPCLLIYGQKDKIAPYHQGRFLWECFKEARLLKVEGCNHFMLPFNDKVKEHLVGFLDEF